MTAAGEQYEADLDAFGGPTDDDRNAILLAKSYAAMERVERDRREADYARQKADAIVAEAGHPPWEQPPPPEGWDEEAAKALDDAATTSAWQRQGGRCADCNARDDVNRNGEPSRCARCQEKWEHEEADYSGLEFLTAWELAAEVDNTPPVGWLCRPVWPADAYGVVAAKHKAGKTWFDLDMVVSVASGTPWLGVYPVERPGPVLVFLGEGGKRKMLRRLRAICASRGLAFEELPIDLCFRAPHLTSDVHLARIAAKVAEVRPVLVVIDPLYLAARGAKSSSLYDMGAHLENVQALVQAHDGALCVIHHWNQTGTGKGADRMSGAGPAEWGRVLVSAEVEHQHTDDETMATAVTLSLQFVGDEIPDTELRIRRRVWAEDPDDLSSPMHYEVERLEAKAAAATVSGAMTPATARVLAVLQKATAALTVREIGDDLASDNTGIPLKVRTIQASLKQLEEAGTAESEVGIGHSYLWRAHCPSEEVA